MKKFFKALALVLALTLVIGTIPASAATGKLAAKKSSIQGLVGTTKTASSLLTGVDTKTQKVTFSVADEKVVEKISSKKMKFVGMGTTTVTVKVWDKSVNTLVDKFAIDVTVIKKSTDETVTVEAPAEVKVGETVTVKAPKADSRKRTIAVADADGNTVETTTVDKSYAFTFVTAKETTYTVTITTIDGVKKTATVVAKEDKLIATDVKQVADNAIKITYNKDVEKDKLVSATTYVPEDIYYILTNTTNKVPFSLIKSVTVKENTATVTFYSSFVADRTYYVTAVANEEPVNFTATGKALKDVVELVIDPTINLYKNEDNVIKYTYYNKAGVDITNAVVKEGYVPEFTVVSDYAYESWNDEVDAKAVFATEADKAVTIKAKLITGYSDVDGTAIEVVAEQAYTTTNAPQYKWTGNIIYSVVDNTVDGYIKNTSTVKHDFAIADQANIQVLFETKKGTDVKYQTLSRWVLLLLLLQMRILQLLQ